MDEHTVGQRRTELRKAVIELRARGLNAPAKWAAEQLTGLPSDDDNEPKPSTTANTDEDEDDTYLLAKSYFDLKVVQTRQGESASTINGRASTRITYAGVSQSRTCVAKQSRS